MKRSESNRFLSARTTADHHATLSAHAADCGRVLAQEVRIWAELGSMLTVWASLHAPGVDEVMTADELDAQRDRVRADLLRQLSVALPHAISVEAVIASMTPTMSVN